MICHEARQWLGAEPGGDRSAWPAALREHVETCAQCQQYAREMQSMETSIKRALEVDLARFRAPAVAPRRRVGWALAASVLLAFGVGAGLWALRSENSLAAAVVRHLADESGSWNRTQPLGQSDIDAVLARSGMHVAAMPMPVVYASSCVFRKHRVPHLVVKTDQGPVTVMLLPDERITAEKDFSEGGYRGVLWPAPNGHGGIAVLARGEQGGDLRSRARELTAQLSGSATSR